MEVNGGFNMRKSLDMQDFQQQSRMKQGRLMN